MSWVWIPCCAGAFLASVALAITSWVNTILFRDRCRPAVIIFARALVTLTPALWLAAIAVFAAGAPAGDAIIYVVAAAGVALALSAILSIGYAYAAILHGRAARVELVATQNQADKLVGELQAATATLNDLIASSADGIAAFGLNGIVTIWNPSAERMSGVPASEAIGRPISDVLPMARDPSLAPLLTRVLQGEQVLLPELRSEAADGKTMWVSVRGTPIRDAAGSITGVLLTSRDITQERVLGRQMAQTEKLSALGQLVAGIAHELNNPLTSIIGYAQFLRNTAPTPKMQRDLDRIVQQGKRSARIIRNLLAFVGEHAPQREPTDINEALRGALEMREYELRAAGIEVEMRLAPDLPMTMADFFQLQQVFFNLIINAEQAMTEAGQGGRLTLTTRQIEGPAIRVEVQDTGPGIPPENLRRIFDPFFTTKSVGKGTGLGLSVCYGIVAEHHGRIWAESEEGAGATFIVELPLVTTGETMPETSEPDAGAPAGVTRILLVDSDESVRQVLSRALTRWGYQSRMAATQDEAWALIESEPFDLILADAELVAGDDSSLLGRLHRTHPDILARVVLLGDELTSTRVAQWRGALAHWPLPKPLDLLTLQRLLQETLPRP